MTAPAAQLPDTWQTTGGLRVEILTTTGPKRRWYWHLVRPDGRVIDYDRGCGYRQRSGATRAAMRRHPATERTETA